MKKTNNFNKIFKPDLTPKQMLNYGVFGESYLCNTIHEYPKSWFSKAKLSKKFDVKLNYFQIRAGLSLKEWKKKGLDLQLLAVYGLLLIDLKSWADNVGIGICRTFFQHSYHRLVFRYLGKSACLMD